MTPEQIEAAAQIDASAFGDPPSELRGSLRRMHQNGERARQILTAASKYTGANELAYLLDVACALVPYTNVTWHKMADAALARHRALLGGG